MQRGDLLQKTKCPKCVEMFIWTQTITAGLNSACVRITRI
jgi:hypothetical protein